MPYKLEFAVDSEGDWLPDLAEQRGMHAILLQAMQATHPLIADSVHEAKLKPFAQALRRHQDGLCWHVTLLDDKLYVPLLAGLQSVTIDHVAHHPLRIRPEPVAMQAQTYETLVEQAPLQRLIVTFASPTCFKQRYYYQPIPTPYLCFQSWWRRWVQFAPEKCQYNVAVLDIVLAHLVVSHFQLRTGRLRDSRQRLSGAVGWLGMVPLRQGKVEEKWWQQAAVLAAYAPFCGTGYKTTHGLGLTTTKLVER